MGRGGRPQGVYFVGVTNLRQVPALKPYTVAFAIIITHWEKKKKVHLMDILIRFHASHLKPLRMGAPGWLLEECEEPAVLDKSKKDFHSCNVSGTSWVSWSVLCQQRLKKINCALEGILWGF